MASDRAPSRSATGTRCVAILETIHYVIKGEKILKREGLAIDVIPVPREISSDCGMALEFSCQDRDRVEQLLADEGVVVVGIFRLQEGQYSRLETGNVSGGTRNTRSVSEEGTSGG